MNFDQNSDGRIDLIDINIVRANWNMAGPVGDVDGSGKVDLRDLALVRKAWGQPEGIAIGTDALDAEEVKFLHLINVYRAQSPTPMGALGASKTLSMAAQWKALDCARHLAIAHDDPDTGRRWIDRIAAYYPYTRQSWVGENIASGGGFDAARVLQAWKDSPGHNGIMLGTAYTAIGIGRAEGGGSFFWVIDLASINDGWD